MREDWELWYDFFVYLYTLPKKPIVINFAFLWGNICWPKCVFIDILSFNSEFYMNIHLHLWALFMYIYPLQKDLFLCLIRGSICWLISIVPLIVFVWIYLHFFWALHIVAPVYGERHSYISINRKHNSNIHVKYVIRLLYMFFLCVML